MLDKLREEWEDLKDEAVVLRREIDEQEKLLKRDRERLRELVGSSWTLGLVRAAKHKYDEACILEANKTLPRIVWSEKAPGYLSDQYVFHRQTPKRVYYRRIDGINEMFCPKDHVDLEATLG